MELTMDISADCDRAFLVIESVPRNVDNVESPYHWLYVRLVLQNLSCLDALLDPIPRYNVFTALHQAH